MALPTDSLYGYDMIVSISEESIDSQMRVLYNTELPSEDRPPPPRNRKTTPNVQAKYLINHDMKIHLLDKRGNPRNDGLSAYIKCPKISLTGLKKEFDPRIASISFEFENFGDSDSVLTYWDGVGPDAELASLTLNGWRMSWEVEIASTKTQIAMEDLLARSADPTQPEKLPPQVITQFRTDFDPRVFLVSSIFCAFQSATIARSFTLTDPDGNKSDHLAIDAFILLISRYFGGIEIEEGRPCPDNPFVLGYGISQDLAKRAEINPTLNWNVPRVFMPMRFNVTTTTPVNGYPGTLNFCIITHRGWGLNFWQDFGEDHKALQTQPDTPGAGIIKKSLFEITKTKTHDGVMAFSQFVMMKTYIPRVFAEKIYISGEMLLNGIRQGRETSFKWNTVKTRNPKPNSYEKAGNFELNPIVSDDQYLVAHGTSSVLTTVTSDLEKAGNAGLAVDAKRRVYINIEVRCFAELRWYFGSPPAASGKSLIRDGEDAKSGIKQHYTAKLIVSAGDAGTWDVTLDPTSVLPEAKNGLLVAKNEENPKETELGAFWYGDVYGHAGQKGENFALMSRLASTAGDFSASLLTGEIGSLMSGLRFNVIMPAGQVFGFSGLDTTSDGVFYTHISYATPQGGSHI